MIRRYIQIIVRPQCWWRPGVFADGGVDRIWIAPTHMVLMNNATARPRECPANMCLHLASMRASSLGQYIISTKRHYISQNTAIIFGIVFCHPSPIFLQEVPLSSSRGIMILNQTLVLQRIAKATHGQYMCRATNLQGTVGSNEVYLDVKCKWNIDNTHTHTPTNRMQMHLDCMRTDGVSEQLREWTPFISAACDCNRWKFYSKCAWACAGVNNNKKAHTDKHL